MGTVPKWKQGVAIVAFLLLAVAGGFGGGVLYSTNLLPTPAVGAPGSSWGEPRLTANENSFMTGPVRAGVPDSFAEVAERVLPAVVSVRWSSSVG